MAAAAPAATVSLSFLHLHSRPGIYIAPAVCKKVVNATSHAPAARLAGSVVARLTQQPIAIPCLPQSCRSRCRAALSAAEPYGRDNEDEDEDGGGEGVDARRLYVGNLPYSLTPSQLDGVFSESGAVERVEVVYDRVTDRSRGFAFVTMGTARQAREAIRMFDGAQVGGRTVKVNFPEVPRGGEREVMGPRLHSRRGFVDSPHKVYAGNLGWAVTSESLADAFADQPGMLGARVIYDRDSGRSRGYGFVSFASPEDARAAIDAMDGLEVEGRPMRLNLAAERATANSQTPQPPETETETNDHGGSTADLLATAE